MADKEIVIVPTFQRSDMLAVTLEAIIAADSTLPIHVFPDRGTSERIVTSRFPSVTEHLTWDHRYSGNTCNVLESLKWARTKNPDVVYIIEDDAIIDPTFFDWSRAALAASPRLFAACGWRYSPDALPPAPNCADTLIPWYLSVAAALPRHSLDSIVRHATLSYYSDMKHYLDAAFPQSHRRGSQHYEQDGLCQRILESESRVCAWPRTPRATHIGFRGYHMPQGQELHGTLDERIRIIKLLLKNPSMLQSLLNSGIPPNIDYCDKCRTPLLTTDQSASVRCVQCFHAAHPSRPQTSQFHYYFPRTNAAVESKCYTTQG